MADHRRSFVRRLWRRGAHSIGAPLPKAARPERSREGGTGPGGADSSGGTGGGAAGGGSGGGRRLSEALGENLAAVKKAFGASRDLVVREIAPRRPGDPATAIVYFDGLVDKTLVADDIIRPLVSGRRISVGEVTEVGDMASALDHVASGDCLQLCDGLPQALAWQTRGWDVRPIAPPESGRSSGDPGTGSSRPFAQTPPSSGAGSKAPPCASMR